MKKFKIKLLDIELYARDYSDARNKAIKKLKDGFVFPNLRILSIEEKEEIQCQNIKNI